MLNLFERLLSKQNIYLSREELDSLRFVLLKNQLIHAYQNIPYYKMAFDRAKVNPINFTSIEDLSLYPIITKDLIRLNSSQLLNRKKLYGSRFKSHTSGSTGQPMWTYYDIKSWIRKKYFVKARARLECGLKLNEKIAIFESASQNSSEKGNILFRTIKTYYKAFSIYDSIEYTVRELMAFSPAALYGSPSYFFRLAQFISKEGYNLPSIKRIFTSSEYLQETVRYNIKKIFNAEVFDIYGSTEFKEVAWECEKHEGYHINEDEVFVEILKDGQQAKHGVIGNIVLTDLRNKIMPLIRFQLQDKGMLVEKKCSCGRTFTMMQPLAGRASEYITLPNDEFLSPYLFTTSIEKITGLLQYQITQITKNKILVNVITDKEDFDRVAGAIKNILSNITNHLMEIEVQLNTNLNIEENGKFKVVKNLILEEKETII